MRTAEARQLLIDQLQPYQRADYAALVAKIDAPVRTEVTGSSGVSYQLQIQFLWDDRPNENLRVLGSIDDAGWRAFVPLTESFIMAPDGTLVG